MRDCLYSRRVRDRSGSSLLYNYDLRARSRYKVRQTPLYIMKATRLLATGGSGRVPD